MNTGSAGISGKSSRNIYGITPFTLLDYPGHPSCILWFAGCNMRCVYCYNPEIVLGKGQYTYTAALEFLESRQGLLQGVVMSGGECLLHPGVPDFAGRIKDMGFLVKADTNGSRPVILDKMLRKGLVDYVALDFKALPEREVAVTGGRYFKAFEHCLDLLMAGPVPFEVRTTVHGDLLKYDDLFAMSAFLKDKGYGGVYYLQKFRSGVPTLGDMESDGTDIPEKLAETSRVPVQIRT